MNRLLSRRAPLVFLFLSIIALFCLSTLIKPAQVEAITRNAGSFGLPMNVLDLLQAVLHPLTRARVGRHLSGERRRLARALEARAAGRLPHDDIAFAIGDRDDRVVERRLDVRLADGDVLAGLAPGTTTCRGATGSRGQCGFLDPFSSAAVAPEVLLLALLADGLLRPLAGARIRLRALTVNREPAAVAQPAVAARSPSGA